MNPQFSRSPVTLAGYRAAPSKLRLTRFKTNVSKRLRRRNDPNLRAPSRIVCGYFAPFALVVHSPFAGAGAACRHGSQRVEAGPIAGLCRRPGAQRLSLFRNWL
jgi:hypothetical protein